MKYQERYLWIAEAQQKWNAIKNFYEKNKDRFPEDEWICEFCKEKSKERGIELEFCLHSKAFEEKHNG